MSDYQNRGLSTLEQQNNLSSFLGDTVSAWIAMLATQLSTLFDGSDDSITLLYSLIENCQTANTGNTTSVLELEPEIEKALWAYMIPVAWAESTKNVLVSVLSRRETTRLQWKRANQVKFSPSLRKLIRLSPMVDE